MSDSKRQEWIARLRRFQEQQPSSVSAFCRSEGISSASFYLWKRRLADEPHQTTTFVPITVANTPTLPTVEVAFPNGIVFRLPANELSLRTLRAIAVGRRNWKFVGSASSGSNAAIHFSVVGSCRHLGIDPFAYLRETLARLHELGANPKDDQLTELLPDAWARRCQTAVTATASVA